MASNCQHRASSLEECTSLNPDDYKWGSIAPPQQAMMNAQFMQMSFFAAFSFPSPMMPFPACVPPPWMKPAPHPSVAAAGEGWGDDKAA